MMAVQGLATDLPGIDQALAHVSDKIAHPRTDLPLIILEIEQAKGQTFDEWMPSASADELRAAIFQVLWTLHVIGQIGLRHGDLHTANIFVKPRRGPNRMAYRLGKDWFALKTNVFVQIFDWDFGGIYEPSFGFVAIDNAKSSKTCSQYSTCGRNLKADLYTFLDHLPVKEFQAKGYDAFVKFFNGNLPTWLYNFDWARYGGFPHRLCAGPFVEKEGRLQFAKAKCQGPWEPADDVLRTPEQLLRDEYFAGYRTERAPDGWSRFTDFS